MASEKRNPEFSREKTKDRSRYANAPLSAEVISGPDGLTALAGEWTDLLARSDQSSPTMSPLWIGTWWRVFGSQEGRELRAVAFRDGRDLVGLAPLTARRLWRRPGLLTWRLQLMPSGEREEDEIASDYLAVVAARGFEQRVADGLAELLRSGGLGRWDELVMPRMSTDSVIVPLLGTALERAGASYLTVTGGSPYIPLPKTWDAYLAALSGSRRRLVRSSLRAFESWCGGRFELRVARDAVELVEGTRVLRDLHEERWREAGKSGAFASQAFSAFHDQVMPGLMARGELELMWLVAADQTVAAIYNIIWDGAVHFYQSGRRMDLPKELRPGVVMHALAIRRAIELGRREYDFLAGGSRYKTDLALAVRPLCSLRVVRRRPADLARRAYERASSMFRAVSISRRNP
jgi:CelD/BcsL family acetyltransferase involved in cellulose biosynthesis